MGEVEHIHEAEDEREARGHQEQHHPHRRPGDGERDPGGAIHRRERQDREQRQHQIGRPGIKISLERGRDH